ncbi:MAG TPA: glycosyl hydrolase family 28 protein [Cyclobacteriaceae bacterium]|nr:glycosyl hydrolase family 28 protein [Cyclobacteriaceae bacterium]
MKINSSIILFYFFLSGCGGQSFDILRFGAVGDGKTVNTVAIQKAIDACFENGGGTVIVPRGVFIMGTVYLKSNIHLYLESGAVLRGSPNLEDYAPFNHVHYGMFYTENSENISITGFGQIDANGDHFFELDKAKSIPSEIKKFTRQGENYRNVKDGGIGDGPVVPKDRPYQTLIFRNCKRVTLRDIFISSAPMWTILFADCDGVNVDGIRLWTNMLAPNADGIDLASCNNVIISNCDIRSGDDAIIIAGYDHHFELPGFSGLRHESQNFVITNCHLQSYSSAIRIGSLDQNSFRNVIISNTTITNSTRGIGIFLRDEGSFENINVSNVVIETRLRTGDWWGNAEPIHISAIRGKDSVEMGSMQNINFDNIICKGENGILVYGTEESKIRSVSFRNVTFELTDSDLNDVAGGNIDLRNCLGEKQIFARDIPGFYAQHIDGLDIENFSLTWTGTQMPYFTHGIEVNNFRNLRIRHFEGTGSPINPAAYPVWLENGENADIEFNIRAKKINIH